MNEKVSVDKVEEMFLAMSDDHQVTFMNMMKHCAAVEVAFNHSMVMSLFLASRITGSVDTSIDYIFGIDLDSAEYKEAEEKFNKNDSTYAGVFH